MTALRWAEGRHFSPAAMWLLGVGVLCGFIFLPAMVFGLDSLKHALPHLLFYFAGQLFVAKPHGYRLCGESIS